MSNRPVSGGIIVHGGFALNPEPQAALDPMRPTPGAYLALIRAGNDLLAGGLPPKNLERHPALTGYRRLRFTEPDGEVSPTPTDWIENLQEFRARRLSLVLFRVIDPDRDEHIVVASDPFGTWGLQVTYANTIHLWLAGSDGGTLDFQGQPVSPGLSEGPPLEGATDILRQVCERARASAPDPSGETSTSLARVVKVLRGGPVPDSLYFGPEVAEEVRRLGVAGQLAWRFCSRATRAAAVRELTADPGELEALTLQLQIAVAGAIVAATNAIRPS